MRCIFLRRFNGVRWSVFFSLLIFCYIAYGFCHCCDREISIHLLHLYTFAFGWVKCCLLEFIVYISISHCIYGLFSSSPHCCCCLSLTFVSKDHFSVAVFGLAMPSWQNYGHYNTQHMHTSMGNIPWTFCIRIKCNKIMHILKQTVTHTTPQLLNISILWHSSVGSVSRIKVLYCFCFLKSISRDKKQNIRPLTDYYFYYYFFFFVYLDRHPITKQVFELSKCIKLLYKKLIYM